MVHSKKFHLVLVHVDDVEILAFFDTVMLVARKQCLSFWIAMVCRGEKRGVDYNVKVFVGVNKRVKLLYYRQKGGGTEASIFLR
jgi:hypothetical protein